MNRLLSVEDGADSAVIRFVPRSVCLDAVNAEVMAHLLSAFLDGQKLGHLVIDFDRVDFLTSEALCVLVSLHKRLVSTGGRLTLLNLRENVYEVFEVTKLTQILRVRRRDGCDHAAVTSL
jgi:anti-sigma B factor antagonist